MPHVHTTAGQAALLVVSAGLAGGWLLMLWLVSTASRQRHVRAQPETGDLGPEPPAVAGMLCRGGRVGDEAAAATLLDLAARHVVDFEETDAQLSLCRIRQPGDAGLAPYERRILSYVDALATGDVVPAPALAAGETRPAAWWRKLRGEVVADARARGLSRPRWSPLLVTALGVPAALPAAGLLIWLVSVTGAYPTLGSRGVVGGTIVAALLGVALVRRLNTDRLTAAGAAAAGRWLGVRARLAADQAIAGQPPAAVTTYGRYLAYAAALGVARTATKSLPIGAPANPRIGWSTYGTGQWHQVDISYSWRPNWGTAPRQMLISRLLVAVPPAAVALLFLAVIPGLPAVGWVALAIVAVALAGAARAVADMAGASSVEGEVVATRPGGQRGGGGWIAVDDGTGSTVRAWRVNASIYGQVSDGDVIRVRVTRIFRHISGLELISHRPRVDVEASLPAAQRDAGQRDEEGTGPRPAGLDLAALVTADDAAGLLGVPVSAAQALNPLEQIPGSAGNPLTRAAALAACRWAAAAGGSRSVDVFAGSGFGAISLLGQLAARAHKTAKSEHGGRLGHGVMVTGNVLVIVRHDMSAAVLLNDPARNGAVPDGTVPQAPSPVLERFAPVLASRLAARTGPPG